MTIKSFIPFFLLFNLLFSCGENKKCKDECCKKPGVENTVSFMNTIKNKNDSALSCKLTSHELQQRKETVIAKIKALVLEKKELQNGFSFKFSGNNEMLDLLADFIKSERQCCDFFSFSIQVKNADTIWLDITGPKGAKEFITTELEL